MVEKPDVIGAIFGQTEGLLGQDLDLRELQKTGRIGRIEVSLKESKGKTTGIILIPSSLDASETALIAAAIETIERIGPCEATIRLKEIKDIRTVKREYVVDRAKKILKKLLEEIPETNTLTDEIKESVRVSEISEYKGLECGPDILNSEEIIIVEGRADVLNLLKNDIKNVVAMGGTTVPKELVDLSKDKKVTVFIDGDRGGDLILKKLKQLIKVDYVIKAPEGKEVEELTKKEIYKLLRDRTHFKEPEKLERELSDRTKEKILDILDKMVGTRAAYVFDEKMKMVGKIPLNRFTKRNTTLKDAKIVLVDGEITDSMVKVADVLNINYLIGDSASKNFKAKNTIIHTRSELMI